MEPEEETNTLPWTPIGVGALLIVAVLASAVLFLRGDGPTYEKNKTVSTTINVVSPPTPTQTPDKAPIDNTPTTTEIPSPSSKIVVTSTLPKELAGPVVIEGTAPGNWYFEASFPVQLKDSDGKVLATAVAQAQGDWMTTKAVPFVVTLRFTPPTATSGMLVFKKDNPSGLPEHDASYEVPVNLKTEKKGANDSIFYLAFISATAAADKDCTATLSAVRVMPKTTAIAKTAIEELLNGPTLEDISNDMLTIIPAGTKLNSLTIQNGVAKADFSDKLTKDVAGACKAGAIRTQIEETLKQFPSVQEVIISVNGKSEGILEP